MPQIPKSKSGQLADLLRERLDAGDWGDYLPAERILAEEYMVSRVTLRQAIAVLVREGRIEAATSTRGGRRLQGGRTRARENGLTQAIVLTPSLAGSPVLLEHLAVLRENLGPAGVQVHVHEAGALAGQERPGAGLRRIVERRPDAVWVLHRMPCTIQEFFAARKLPAVVFGSTFPGLDLPSVDIDFRAVGRHAAGLCLARGCRRISLLVHRTHLAGDVRTVEAVTAELESKNVPPPQIMRYDFNRMRLMDGLDHDIVAGHAPCDALIIANQHHLLTALPHLLRRNIRIPEDLSLISLSNDPVIERLSPLPCRYDSGSSLVRKLASAIKAFTHGEIPVSHRIIPKLLDGETLRQSTPAPCR